MPFPDSKYEKQWRDARNWHAPQTPCASAACWWVQDNTDEPFGQLRVDGDEGAVCIVGQNDSDWTVGDDRRRMAHLIAAAPEMLAALELGQHMVWGDVSEVAAWCSIAKSAIAKAEGRSE